MNDKLSGNCLDSFKQSVECAQWITATDIGTITLGRRLAAALDVAFDAGDIGDVAVLAPKLLAVLQQLHLTTETRTQGKQEEQHDGTDFASDYLRLVNPTATNKAKSRSVRGPTGGTPSKRPRSATPAVAKTRSK
jgi:hypothetical protein